MEEGRTPAEPIGALASAAPGSQRNRAIVQAASRLVVIVVCALAQLRVLEFASGLETNLKFGMDVAWAWNGWSGYRSRLLAPALIHLLGGNMRAFLVLTFIGLVLGGWLSWRVAGLGGLGIYHGGFALLASPWFSPWDIFDPVIFMAFVLLVAERGTVWRFVGLFAVGIFNLQSAMFITLWMVLSRKMIVAGLVCGLAGVAIMRLLQHSGAPHLGLFIIGTAYGTDYGQEHVLENIRNAGPLVVGIFALIIGAAWTIARRDADRFLALAITYVALALATLLFALTTETRVYLDFIPLWVLAAKVAESRQSRRDFAMTIPPKRQFD